MQTPRELIIVRQKYTPFGGGERFLAQALDTLVDQGVRIRVLCRDWRTGAPYEITRLPSIHLTRTQRDKSFARLACTHIHAAPGALVQSHERIPCCDIYRAGEGIHREWLRQRARKRNRYQQWLDSWSPYHRYLLRAERRLFNSSRLRIIICNSHRVKQQLQQHYQVPEHKIRVIYNGVDLERYHPQKRAELRQQARQDWQLQDQLTYLFVGSGYERKGLDTLLHAYRALPDDTRLIVVGKDRRIKQYQAMARQLGIAERVRFVGPQTDMPSLYAAADVLVLPTLYDPFPNVVLEAMACGLPVITSYQCGAVDVIQSGDNGWLCDALSVETLQAHMISAQHKQTRLSVGMAGRQTVSQFTFARLAKAYLDLYQELI